MSNSYGSQESAPAIVQVVPATFPAIIEQPQGGTFWEGTNLVVSVTATNLLPLTYQWRRKGIDSLGETNRALFLDNVLVSGSGGYSVRISSEIRSILSSDAVVRRLRCPVLEWRCRPT